jgi:membrane dipeptidase
LQAMATNNGLVMVNFYPSFLDDGWRVAWKAAEKERKPLYEAAGRRYREQGQPLPYSVSMQVDRDFYANEFSRRQELPDFGVVIDHLDHIARVAGINHVGLGSDFDGFALPARGMETAAMLPAITAGLMERGYTAEQVCKILGGNLLRVMRDVESEASKQ